VLTYLTPILGNVLLWLWLAALVALLALTRSHRRRRRAAVALLAAAWLLACPPVAELFLRPLEGRFPRPTLGELTGSGVRQVVVLTGGGYQESGGLWSSAFPAASAHRFLGGVELCARLSPDCRLIFSGSAGRGRGHLATAESMGRLATALLPGHRILAEADSDSTAEHPGNVRPLLDDGPFLLVTSAYHLPRAVRSFRRAGLDPIPYPVDRAVHPGRDWSGWLPATEGLTLLQLAWREYQALLLYTLRGW